MLEACHVHGLRFEHGRAQEIAGIINRAQGERIGDPDQRQADYFVCSEDEAQGEYEDHLQANKRQPGDEHPDSHAAGNSARRIVGVQNPVHYEISYPPIHISMWHNSLLRS